MNFIKKPYTSNLYWYKYLANFIFLFFIKVVKTALIFKVVFLETNLIHGQKIPFIVFQKKFDIIVLFFIQVIIVVVFNF